jgi:tetratricopeptide (TPR) repeat protein
MAEILGIDDVHPADHQWADVLDEAAAAIKDPRAFGPEQPFVPIGGEEIDEHIRDMKRQHAEGLNGIDAEQDFAFGAELAYAGQIVALAAGEFDVGEGDQARFWLSGGGEDFFDGNLPGLLGTGLFLDHDQLHPPAAGDFHPGVNIGGVFDVGGNDAIAELPVDAVGDDADPLAGVFNEGDLIAMAAEQRGGFLPKLFDILIPAGGKIGGGFGLHGEGPHGIGGGARQWGNAGMIEKRPFPQDRELLGVAGRFHDRVHGLVTYNTRMHRLGLGILAGIVLATVTAARGGVYDDMTIPGKWLKPLVPEQTQEPQYPDYDQNSAVDKAWDQYWAGQYRRALVTLESVKKGKPVRIALIRAECQLELGRYEDALATLANPAVAQNPQIKTLRARVMAAQGGYTAAIGILQNEIKAYPDLVAPRYYLGEYREKLGDIAGATAAYDWFIDGPRNYLQDWIGHPETFNDAEEVTLMGRAIDRWATLTMAYQHEMRLHDVVLNMFVRAYDQIDQGYWPAHLAAAESFFVHDDPQSAADELNQALKANPSFAQSWLLYGRMMLQQFNFDGVDRAVNAIRSENEDSVDADVLEGRNLLGQQMPKLALAPLERALAAQPTNLETLGLLAAAQAELLQDDKSAATLKLADSIAPASAVAYFEVAEQLAAMRQYPRSAAMYRIAVERAPWWTSARNGLGMLYAQSGDEDQARKILDAAHTLDPFNYSTTNYLRLLDIMAKFAKSESAHFIVIYDATQDPIVPEYFNDYLESVYPIVTGEFKYEPKVKTLIEVFPTQDEFAVRTTGAPWLPTVGASTGRIIALAAPRTGERTTGPFNFSQVLRHEFTHTVTLGATDNRISHWFTEGLAVQQEHSPIRWEWVPMLYDAVTRHYLFPIDELTWAFVRPRHPIDRSLAYAQSSWICQYIEQTYGHAAILGMMEQYRLGHTEDEVFENVLHRTESQFMDEFEAWCQQQVAGWGYDEATSKKYDELRHEGEDLISQRQFPLALPIWEQIAKLRPMDILPHKRLAALYKLCDQPEKSAEQLGDLAAVELNNNAYAKATARAYRDVGNMDEALRWAKRAVYTNLYDPDAHRILEDIDERRGDADGVTREKRVIEELAAWKQMIDAAATQP